MIEPANTPLNRFFIRNFHHEPFDVHGGWDIKGEGRLSAANGALPWIIFMRDRDIFHSRFKDLSVRKLYVHAPFRYLLSGGLSFRPFLPYWMYLPVQFIEMILAPFNRFIGFFQTIVIEKV